MCIILLLGWTTTSRSKITQQILTHNKPKWTLKSIVNEPCIDVLMGVDWGTQLFEIFWLKKICQVRL